VRTSQQAPSPWQQFINNWASDAFQGYVDWLAAELDTLASAASEPLRREMEEHFLATVRYEYLFWNMAAQGEQWPG
jgi:thiaminase/transcriptional activator TenA